MRSLAIMLASVLMLALTSGALGCQNEEVATTLDSDGDGWTDAQEEIAGSDPFNVDTDSDGHWDPLDPNPLDANIPAAPTQTPVLTPAPTPTLSPTPISSPTPTSTPTSTPKPPRMVPLEMFPEGLLSECALQFLTENDKVTGATANQSTDAKTIFLPFSIHWETPHADMKPLGEEFIRLVKSKVDTPPGIEIGSGTYNYVTYVNDLNGVLMVQGSKCAECDTITWL